MALRIRLDRRVDVETPAYGDLVLLLALVWGVGDTLSTIFASNVAGSVAGEVNPLLRVLLSGDPLAVVLLKVSVVLYASFVLFACRDQVEQVPGWHLWFLGMIAGGMVIVAQNLSVVIVALVWA